MHDIAKEKNLEIVEIEADKDHIHLLVSYDPTQSILEIVRLLKQMSTFRIWHNQSNYAYLQKHF